MNVPIRIKQYRENTVIEKFSLLSGLKMLWFNLKTLATYKMLRGTRGWYEVSESIDVVNDVSLIFKDDTAVFVKTPEDIVSSALEISQIIE